MATHTTLIYPCALIAKTYAHFPTPHLCIYRGERSISVVIKKGRPHSQRKEVIPCFLERNTVQLPDIERENEKTDTEKKENNRYC